MAALEYVDRAGYNALIMRRTIEDLKRQGALIERSKQWLNGTDAEWSAAENKWRFPSGATLSFGYMRHEGDRLSYESAEYQFIGIDEGTQWSEADYTYMFSRLRKESNLDIPTRMRCTGMPGNAGHQWVKRRFITDRAPGTEFVPANIRDNPTIDADDYIENMGLIDNEITRKRLAGDWDAEDDSLLSYNSIVDAEIDAVVCTLAGFEGIGCEEAQWVKGQPVPELHVGIDIGRTQDRTCIWTWRRMLDIALLYDMYVLDNVSFSDQKTLMRAVLSRDLVVAGTIDQGGIGMQLHEELAKDFKFLSGFSMGEAVQGRLAQGLLTAFNESKIRLVKDEDAEIRDDFQLVKANEFDQRGAVTKVKTLKGKTGHADRFWAAALGHSSIKSVKPRKTVARPRGFPAKGARVRSGRIRH